MHVLYGSSALVPFRLARLGNELVAALPGLRLVAARQIYLLAGEAPAEEYRRRRLAAMLDASVTPVAASVYVLPRFGTLSPWSSKAGEILAHCDLGDLGRIERGVAWVIEGKVPGPTNSGWQMLEDLLSDRLTQVLLPSLGEAGRLFRHFEPPPERLLPLSAMGVQALDNADARLGLALGAAERDYLLEAYGRLGRDPTETELMMFAQVNSEHCRHKIFRGRWTLDGNPQTLSPFDCIRVSYNANPDGILSAYRDNAAVIEGHRAQWFSPDPVTGRYHEQAARLDIVIKVETHNHPTGVAPLPGAATGAGGEIRDEAATGRGGTPKAGLTGFVVSDLRLPGAPRPWECAPPPPSGLASALHIMLEAPIGAASYNNEFGRPAISGFFRSFCIPDPEGVAGRYRGYHKPLMLAGGLGTIHRELIEKQRFRPGAKIIVLGGPAMEIGLGGGAASSRAGGEGSALDFASVQRDNPEMQRRAQEVIAATITLGEADPVLAIHDVGAGGLANAVPELLHEAGCGGRIDLARVPSAEPGMSALALWCNEAQERYVLAIAPEDESRLAAFAERERCPWAVIGTATAARQLVVHDGRTGQTVVDLPMQILLGDLPPLEVRGKTRAGQLLAPPTMEGISVPAAIERVLALPGVGDKEFLITIGDRSVGGLVARDQLVGPWQVAVADVAVTLADYRGRGGEAMAIGERMPIAVHDAPASARMAVGEAITNLAAADVERLTDVRLSANWMAATGTPADNADLYRAVQAVGAELAPALGVAIPVGKDSLSMRVAWTDPTGDKDVRSPLSLVVSAFAPVTDAGVTLTPQLAAEPGTELWLIDLGAGANRLGGSAFAQVFQRSGDPVPDLGNSERLKGFFMAVRKLAREGCILAYHDRSDGGLAVTLIEMALAAHMGFDVDVATLGSEPHAALFTEELGAVIQIRIADVGKVKMEFSAQGLAACLYRLGTPREGGRLVLRAGEQCLYAAAWTQVRRLWSEVDWRLRSLRDEPGCAREAYDAQCDPDTPGLGAVRLGFNPDARLAPALSVHRPQVAILREQGVNGHRELAAAFDRAGFDAIDIHMSELAAGSRSLAGFSGLAAPGGFAYGDVLGAGQGWAKSVLYHSRLRDEFKRFLAAEEHFALGICNGCQMFSALTELIPGAAGWPRLRRNRSEQFEARLVLVEVLESVSPFFDGMTGAVLPVVVAHREGRVKFTDECDLDRLIAARQVTLRYVEKAGYPATTYPANPNGSPGGVTGFTNTDGRILAMMPHPERVLRTLQHSWHPAAWGEAGPWLHLFENIRAWVG